MNEKIDQLLAPAAQQLPSSCFARVRAHLLSQLLCLGRHTITGLLSTQGRVHQDWSADYRLYSRGRLDPELLFGCVRQGLRRLRPRKQPRVLGLDDSLLRKRGPKVHGVRWLRDPLGPPFSVNFVRGQRVVQFSEALPGSQAQARMVPVDFQHAPLAPKPSKTATAEEIAAHKAAVKEQNINAVAARRLQHLAAEEPGPLITVCDGRFANRTFLRAAATSQSTIISRIRKDSVLHWPAEQQPATGRRRLYGERAPTPQELRQDENTSWQRVRAWACGRMHNFKVKRLRAVLSPMQGAQPCQVLVIAPLGYRPRASSRVLYRQPAYLLCTDSKMSLRRMLQSYLWRWEIEVNFRDEKTLLGVGQAQVRTAQSAARVPATAVAAYGLLLLAAAEAYPEQKDLLLPPPRWRARKPPRPSTATLLDHLRFELFSHALKPESFTGFWALPRPDQKPPNPDASLPSALFLHRV